MKKHLSKTDLIIIGTTMALFITALFVKGITKDLLLEAGVLLVSIKLIIMNFHTSITNKKILDELDNMKETLTDIKNTKR